MGSGRSLLINSFHLLPHGPLFPVSKPRKEVGKPGRLGGLRLGTCQEGNHTPKSGAPNLLLGVFGDFLGLQNQETFLVLSHSLASSSHTQPETESWGLDWTLPLLAGIWAWA